MTIQLKYVIRLALCGTLVLSYSFDVKSEGKITMLIAIEKILRDSIRKQSNSLFISEKTTLQSHNEFKPNELLDDLLQFRSNETATTIVIDSTVNYINAKCYNHLFIVDSYESFR